MSGDSRPDRPQRSPEDERSRRIAALITFVVFLVLGLAVAVSNTPRDSFTGEADYSGYAIPFLLAGGLSWAAYRGGGKGVLIAVLAILLSAGLTCAVIINNLEF